MKKERCQLVFVSPELLLCNRRCREMLRSEVYRKNLIGVVVDEAHCVKTWLVSVILDSLCMYYNSVAFAIIGEVISARNSPSCRW